MIGGLYNYKTIDNIKSCNHITWIGGDFELNIKLIDEKLYPDGRPGEVLGDKYLYYHITGYIDYFNPVINSQDLSVEYLNRLNIDTLVRTAVTVTNDTVIHNDLSLKIYNDFKVESKDNAVIHDKKEWGEVGLYALPYDCMSPDDDFHPKEFDTTESVDAEGNNNPNFPWTPDLARGHVNMSSINGPYSVDNYTNVGDNILLYRVVQSVWFTTTYYTSIDPNP